MSSGLAKPGPAPPTRPVSFSPPDALLAIVTSPRETMRRILDHGDGGLWVFLGIGGIAYFALAVTQDLLREATEPSSWKVACVAGAATALAGALFLLGCFGVFARMFGGTGSLSSTAIALAWGAWPIVITLPVLVASPLIPAHSPWIGTLALLTGPVALCATLVYCGCTIAAAHRLPAVRAGAVTLVASLPGAFFLVLGYGLVDAWFQGRG